MKNNFLQYSMICLCLLLGGVQMAGAMIRQSSAAVVSPDKNLSVEVFTEDGVPAYTVSYKGKNILEKSPLGLVTNVGDFSKGMKMLRSKQSVVDESYTLDRIKQSQVRYQASRLICTFENEAGWPVDVVFQVSDNDVAFRYVLAPMGETMCCVIEKETTGFNFPTGTTTFLTPYSLPMSQWKRTKPSYEEEYVADEPMGTPSQYGLGYTFPGLFHGDDSWTLVSETGVTGDYCASHLSDCNMEGVYSIAFPDERENNGGGSSTPSVALPCHTPWRTITVGDNLKPIVETTIPFDVVAQRCEPTQSYRPGRSTWSWIMWQDGSMNYDDQKAYIDFAALMGYEYVLMDALWDAQVGYDRMKELVNYAKSKGVGVFLWYNSNGSWNDAPQTPKDKMHTALARKKEMSWLREAGVKGLKVDFFGGDKQQTMQLYEDILVDANEYGLMVVFHGCTLPRGWERMYPNYMGSEAVLASENLIFQQHFCDNEAFNACLHPFIRNAVGSMEFGPVLLNKRHNRTNDGGNVRRTTDVFQLATAVLFQNPVQMFALTPNNLTDAPWFAMDFMMAVPTVWDETLYIDGYPGKYCVVARRSGNKWYVAGINAQDETCRLKLRLPMLEGKTFMKYRDDDKRCAHAERMTLNHGEEVLLEILPGGGVVLATPNEDLWQAVRDEDFIRQARGDAYVSDELRTFRVPVEYPQEGSPLFNVSINGKYTGIYTDINAWKQLVSFGYFDMKPGKEMKVEINVGKSFEYYKILPESSGIVSEREGQTIRFSLKDADENLSIVFDDDYKGNVLHLFANAMDENAPVQSSDDVLYFAPGYHDLTVNGAPYLVPEGKDVYIAGGAVVHGSMRLVRQKGNKIYGHGILMNTIPGGLVLDISRSTDIEVDGIIVCSHRNPGWTVGVHESSEVDVRNLKVVSTRYASTDGLDVINSSRVRVTDSFIRSCDDAVAVKGLAQGKPADCPPNEDLHFEHLQLWNDCNNAMCLGAETHARYYRRIRFKDIDVLSSYDDKYHHEELDERSVMTIVALQGTYFRDISWEDIRVNRCERLICLTFKDEFWFGTISGNQSTAGGIDGVEFKSISVSTNSGSRIANEILLNGWHKQGTPDKMLKNITFDNVMVEGRHIKDDAMITKGKTSKEYGLIKRLNFK